MKQIVGTIHEKKEKILFLFILGQWIIFSAVFCFGNSVSTSFTYQGKLNYFSNPADGSFDFEFKLFDAESLGGQVGSTIQKNDLAVSNGLFAVELDFGSSPYTGNGLWLEISVRQGAETGAYTMLTPRQKVNPTPYSQYSYNSGALGGNTADDFWKKGGNAGATQNTLGTTENYSLDIIANNARVVKFQPHATSPSIIGGNAANTVPTGVAGGALSGGGSAAHINKITDNYGTIAGGEGNIAGDDSLLVVDAVHATVGGGYGNVAGGSYSTVPGGRENTATGVKSLAAGYKAKASHDGAFVWSDASSDAAFQSTAANQFLIRAAGGVGIGQADPDSPLDILGGNWDLASTEGDMRIGNDTYRLKMGVALAGGGSGTARIRSVGGQNSLILGSGSTDILTVKGSDVSNSGEYKYTAARTFVKHLPAGMFHPEFDYSANLHFDKGAIITHDTHEAKIFYFIPVPVELPDGAVVTELKLYYHDNWTNEYFHATQSDDFSLKRRGVLNTSEEVMAGIAFSTEGLPNSDSIRTLSTTSISNATINNTNYQYYIYVHMYLYSDGSNLGFYGASITYTATTLKP